MYETQIDTPEEELKRADHLVFVSLKYTRTCDVMKNAIKRMIAAYELAMKEFLEYKRKNKQIENVPESVKERAILMKNILESSGKKYLTLYNLLKKIDKAEYSVFEEFRKNVTLRVKLPKSFDVKVENLYNYLETTKEFVLFIRQLMK